MNNCNPLPFPNLPSMATNKELKALLRTAAGEIEAARQIIADQQSQILVYMMTAAFRDGIVDAPTAARVCQCSEDDFRRNMGVVDVQALEEVGRLPELCKCCKKAKAMPLHPCPNALELDHDDTPCNCCEDCEEQCARDI